jgi:hypothetical protein
MQKIEKFRVAAGDIAIQLQDYLDDNSGATIVSLTTVINKGDEMVIALVDDGT